MSSANITAALEHEENYADVHTLIQKIPSFRSIATYCNSNVLRMYRLIPIILDMHLYFFLYAYILYVT